MKEITLIVKYSVKNGMVNDFLTALKNEIGRSTRLNSSHRHTSRMPSSA